MLDVPLLLVAIVGVALIFDFTNGVHDCANAIATVVTTKVLSPQTAVVMAAVLNLVGALLGSEVAHTLGKGVVNTEVVSRIASRGEPAEGEPFIRVTARTGTGDVVLQD